LWGGLKTENCHVEINRENTGRIEAKNQLSTGEILRERLVCASEGKNYGSKTAHKK